MSEFTKLVDQFGMELSEAIETGKLEEILEAFNALSFTAIEVLKSKDKKVVMNLWKAADAKFKLVRLADDKVKAGLLEMADGILIRFAIEKIIVPWVQKQVDKVHTLK